MKTITFNNKISLSQAVSYIDTLDNPNYATNFNHLTLFIDKDWYNRIINILNGINIKNHNLNKTFKIN